MSALTENLGRLFTGGWRRDRVTIPVVRLSGGIGTGRVGANLSLKRVEGALKKAFATRDAPAVALVINSPGGSAVQSHLIHKRIRDLAAEKDKKVLVAIEDIAASGGYVLSLAGDEILADPNSIVGSIGVIFAGFGFTGLLERIGVDRRVHASGEFKGMLDPFKPESEGEVDRLRALQGDVFSWFVDLVKDRRGDKLGDDPDLFTGAFWSGRRALELGLIDELGDLRSALRKRYGDKVRLRPIATERRRMLGRLGLSASVSGLVDAVIDGLAERSLWSRYGL